MFGDPLAGTDTWELCDALMCYDGEVVLGLYQDQAGRACLSVRVDTDDSRDSTYLVAAMDDELADAVLAGDRDLRDGFTAAAGNEVARVLRSWDLDLTAVTWETADNLSDIDLPDVGARLGENAVV
jgi:hypothetical protein